MNFIARYLTSGFLALDLLDIQYIHFPTTPTYSPYPKRVCFVEPTRVSAEAAANFLQKLVVSSPMYTLAQLTCSFINLIRFQISDFVSIENRKKAVTTLFLVLEVVTVNIIFIASNLQCHEYWRRGPKMFVN